MSSLLQEEKTAFSTPMAHWWIVVGCLALSFVDMLLLSTALGKLTNDLDQVGASLLAFCLALIGTITAFLWGRSQALHKNTKVWKFYELWVWLAIGIIFIIMRLVVVVADVSEFPEEAFSIISSEALMAVVLSILYIGTGLVVRSESRKIFDPALFSEWRQIGSAKKVQNKIANKFAETERMLIELDSFQKNYHSLDKQYVIRKNALMDAERTTLSTVVKRMLEDNPHLSPQVVDDILQSILNERTNN